MIIAGVLVRTVPGAAPRIAAALATRPGVDLQGGDGDGRIALVWTGPSGAALVQAARALLEAQPDILGIHPTLVGDDTEGPRDTDATGPSPSGRGTG